MKKNQIALILFLFGLLLSGCPYESSVPIDKPVVKINPGFLGIWEDKKNHDIYRVESKDEFTYSIVQTENGKRKADSLLAYPSFVRDSMFLNIWNAEGDAMPLKYSFYKLTLNTDKTLTLSEITENIDEIFSSSDQLKKFIELNMNNSYFFGKSEINLIRTQK